MTYGSWPPLELVFISEDLPQGKDGIPAEKKKKKTLKNVLTAAFLTFLCFPQIFI